MSTTYAASYNRNDINPPVKEVKRDYVDLDYPQNLQVEPGELPGSLKVSFSTLDNAFQYMLSISVEYPYGERNRWENFEYHVKDKEINDGVQSGSSGGCRDSYGYGEKVVYNGKIFDYGYNSAPGYVVIYEEGECNMQDSIAVPHSSIKRLNTDTIVSHVHGLRSGTPISFQIYAVDKHRNESLRSPASKDIVLK